MKRRPQRAPLAFPSTASPDAQQAKDEAALYHKDAVSPWHVSGGSSWFLSELTSEFNDARAAGVQLVCSVYVPKGTLGFLKELRVAPFRPAVFNPALYAINSEGQNFFQYIGFNPPGDSTDDPVRPSGVWETPFAWENYFDSYDREPMPPVWRWYLKILNGSIDELRSHNTNLPPEPIAWAEPPNPDVLESWFLVPDVAVPAAVYRGGLPGSSPGDPWDGQRVQVIQGDKLSLHVPIPENSTLCLFTRWRQKPIEAMLTKKGDFDNSRESYSGTSGELTRKIYPLLPSWGSLTGYCQSANLKAGKVNAEHGWNG